MITYNEVQAAYRREKSSNDLQSINPNFYSDVRELLTKIEGEHHEYVKKLVCEIFERRRNKIVLGALRSVGPDGTNMIPLEKALYEDLEKTLIKHREIILSASPADWSSVNNENIYANPRETSDQVIGLVRIRFMKSMPAIVGSNLVHYGPFNEGDVGELPLENARVLLENGIAEEA